MKKYNSIELLTGFFMGSFTGTLIEWALLGLYNWMSHWRGQAFFWRIGGCYFLSH
jgi:hypothetical protein